MLLSLCLLLPTLSPSSQEICSAPGALPAPTLYLSQTSTLPGYSVRLQCTVFSQAPATRIVFCKDGKEVSSQTGPEEKVNYKYVHMVSSNSSGHYACGYEIKDSDNQVIKSQLSPAQHLSVTGTLPAPTLHLNQTSALPGNSVWLQCSVFNQAPVTRTVFYKDGEEVSFQTGSLKKVNYDYVHVVSSNSSGNYACGYEIKGSDNQVTTSQLSPAQQLSVIGNHGLISSGLDLKLLLGITVPAAAVVLAVVFYLLGRKAASLRRNQRERVHRGISNIPEELTDYASVDWQRRARHLRPQREENPVYANIAKKRDRCH